MATKKYLIIQTAFIGDVILATPIIEKLKKHFPNAQIDFLLRKGNESLLHEHPHLHQIYIWNKKEKKYPNLFQIIKRIRTENYDKIINLHRFAASGIVCLFSGAKETIGFDKNPLSFFYNKKIKHQFGTDENFIHEVDRNLSLIQHFTDNKKERPKLYPLKNTHQKIVENFDLTSPYICIAPTSVWFTKQFPYKKWIELIQKLNPEIHIYLLGAPTDKTACEQIKTQSQNPKVKNLAGTLSLLESAALMEKAKMNYVNDSAPLHLCSATNANVIALFCSTLPQFGFTPLSDYSKIIETSKNLNCRPCGLHGHKECPERHFECADIDIDRLLY